MKCGAIAILFWTFTVSRSLSLGYVIPDGTVTRPTLQQCEEVRETVMLVTGARGELGYVGGWSIGPCYEQPR